MTRRKITANKRILRYNNSEIFTSISRYNNYEIFVSIFIFIRASNSTKVTLNMLKKVSFIDVRQSS